MNERRTIIKFAAHEITNARRFGAGIGTGLNPKTTKLYDHSFTSALSVFYWLLLPEYFACQGWMAAVVLPTSPTENRNQATLKPTEQVIITQLHLLKSE